MGTIRDMSPIESVSLDVNYSTLSWKNKLSSAHGIFSTVFFLTVIGSLTISLNAKLMGSKQ